MWTTGLYAAVFYADRWQENRSISVQSIAGCERKYDPLSFGIIQVHSGFPCGNGSMSEQSMWKGEQKYLRGWGGDGKLFSLA